MSLFDLFSIGHSNIPAERFLELLQIAGVNAVADVRSVPASRFCPWFSRKSLEPRLAREGIAYLPGGDRIGGRPTTKASIATASPTTRRKRCSPNFAPASIA